MSTQSLVIAEAGVNHNGQLEMAVELVDCAALAGANCIKFQTFDAKLLVSANAPKADYQSRRTDADESQQDMLQKLQLSRDAHVEIMKRCADQNIRFLSSPFDQSSLRLLTEDLGLKQIKLGSGELTNAPLLIDVARTDAEIILSTGMATLSEVEEALGVLAFGMLATSEPSSRKDFADVLSNSAAWSTLAERVTLLHCTTEYPAPVAETNLRAMDTLRTAFGLRVGYSDHTNGAAVSIAAIARGAEVIEKHFTLDRTLPGPDHAASLEPAELQSLVRDIRAVESALGSGVKQPGPSEMANREIARKSLHAARDISRETPIRSEDLTTMRPGTGISPMSYWDSLGTFTSRDTASGEMLT